MSGKAACSAAMTPRKPAGPLSPCGPTYSGDTSWSSGPRSSWLKVSNSFWTLRLFSSRVSSEAETEVEVDVDVDMDAAVDVDMSALLVDGWAHPHAASVARA